MKKLYRFIQEIKADDSVGYYTEEQMPSGSWLFVSGTFSSKHLIAEDAYKRCLLGQDQRKIILSEGEAVCETQSC